MNILVLYDSVFGNTEKIARAIAYGLGPHGAVDVLAVGEASPDKVRSAEILIVGSPTRGFRPTEAVSKFLNGLGKGDLKGIGAACFDTRIALETIDSSVFRLIVDKGGYAANTIAKLVQKKGGSLLAPPEGFYVTGEQGPLKENELERARAWGAQVGSQRT